MSYIDLTKTREEAFKLAQTPYKIGDENFGKYSSIYLAATSNVKDTLSLYHDYESVLALGATGALGYEALLNGAKKVDLFDINELQRIYYEYLKTAIMILPYEEFVHYFTLPKQNKYFKKEDIRHLLSNELYYRISFFLDEDINYVLEPLFDFFYSPDLILSSLFRFEFPLTLDYLKKYISFYNKEEYYKLQSILRKNPSIIKYHQVSINDVRAYFADNKYDLILLDNVLQYFYQIPNLETPYKVNMFIDKELSKLLNNHGAIAAAYGFEVAADALKISENIPLTGASNPTAFSNMIIKQAKKKDLITNLVRKWNHYSYNFIPGVEEDKRENVVLTYRKR